MPLLQVRNFPEDLYEELKREAEREDRSIAQQTTAALRFYFANKDRVYEAPYARAVADTIESNKARRKRAIEAIRKFHEENPGIFEGAPDAATVIREGREERDARCMSW